MVPSPRAGFIHLVARASRLPVPLSDHDVASWLWPRLARRFPLGLACVLMPNHLHLLTPTRSADVDRLRLARLLGALARAGGPRSGVRFEPIPATLLEHDASKVARVARYVALNPVRGGLVRDPLEWPWSTHRDVFGAIARPWVTAARLAAALGRREEGFASWWAGYVAREDQISADAVAVPMPAAPARFPTYPLEDVARAVARSMRARVSDIQKRGPVRSLFLVVAPLVGWTGSALLAAYCGVTSRAIQKSFHRPPPVAIEAALLCLGDRRLRDARPVETASRAAAR